MHLEARRDQALLVGLRVPPSVGGVAGEPERDRGHQDAASQKPPGAAQNQGHGAQSPQFTEAVRSSWAAISSSSALRLAIVYRW
jgi:hypothetical protein